MQAAEMDEEDDSITQKEDKKNEFRMVLQSKKALRAFHSKCMETVQQRNVTYLDQDDMTHLLGGRTEVKPAFVAEVINMLLSHNLIEYFTTAEGKGLCKPVKDNTAINLSALSPDEHIIYTRIQQAGTQGIWSQILGKTTNIHGNILNKCLKSLESKRIIKRVKSVKYTYRVIYMLYNLEPGDELTGGPWYNEQNELDQAFVSTLLDVAERVVHRKTYPPPKKVDTADGVRKLPQFWTPAYTDYATAEDVYDFIIQSKILHDDTLKETFGISHVHRLLEVLCYRKRIYKRADGVTYSTKYSPEELGDEEEDEYYDDEMVEKHVADAVFGHKGYSEAPCGRCPVFRVCGNPGDSVNASNCEYWDDWTNRIPASDLF